MTGTDEDLLELVTGRHGKAPARTGEVVPAWLRYHDQDLGTNVRRGIGFRVVCRCGHRGELRRLRSLAVADLAWHRRDAHDRNEGGPSDGTT